MREISSFPANQNNLRYRSRRFKGAQGMHNCGTPASGRNWFGNILPHTDASARRHNDGTARIFHKTSLPNQKHGPAFPHVPHYNCK